MEAHHFEIPEAAISHTVTAKLHSWQSSNSHLTSCNGQANPNLFYFNNITKKGAVYWQLSHTSEVSLAAAWDQNGLSHGTRMWLQKIQCFKSHGDSLNSLHYVVQLLKKSTSKKGAKSTRYLPLSLSYHILIFSGSTGMLLIWRGFLFLTNT